MIIGIHGKKGDRYEQELAIDVDLIWVKSIGIHDKKKDRYEHEIAT